MTFSDQAWRKRAAIKLTDFQHWLKKGDASYITYSTIAGLTIWPLVEAAVKTGQWQTVLITLYSVVSGVGANLVAEQLQRWRDQAQKNEPISENDVIAWIGQKAANRTEERQAIDAIITHFEAIPQLRRVTDGKDWQEIADSLRRELQKLGTLEAFSPIINSVVASGEHSVAVGGDVNAPILTGAQATYIAQQNIVQARSYEPAMLPPKLQAYLFSLYDLIRRYFNLEELRTLCFEVNVEFDDLPGDGLGVRVRELVYYLDRQQRIPELIKHLERLRPETQWPVYYPIEDVKKAPFKGLDFFNEEDADLFFGREELTAQLAEYLDGHRFLAVVGASGSGKSSVVRAGVIPTLRHDKARHDGTKLPKDSKDWFIVTMTPSRNPLQELALALTKDLVTVGETGVIEKELVADGSLNLYVRKLLERQIKTQLLVVVDQFEELFALCENESIRQVFVEKLLKTAVSESSRLKVLIVLRADFYAQCDQYPILREAVSQNQIFIGAMNGGELRQAIEKPAMKEGWAFENGLVDIFLRDIGAEGDREPEPGALPLLSHALLETWRRHSQHVLTLQGYLAAGAVQGAIAETAETTYQSLSAEQQKLIRQLFYSLTAIVDGLYTRRRVYREDIQLRGVNKADLDKTIQKLVESRLIITNIETQTDRQTIEVAHEALIRAWPRLQDWLERDRDFLHWQQTILPLARAWDKNGRDSRPPLQGGTLVIAEEWLETRGEDISSTVIRDIIIAAQKQRIREQRRRQQLFLGAIVATLAMALLAIWGLTSSQRANEREADAVAAQSTAEAETERADANALEAEGQASLAAARQFDAEQSATQEAIARINTEARSQIMLGQATYEEQPLIGMYTVLEGISNSEIAEQDNLLADNLFYFEQGRVFSLQEVENIYFSPNDDWYLIDYYTKPGEFRNLESNELIEELPYIIEAVFMESNSSVMVIDYEQSPILNDVPTPTPTHTPSPTPTPTPSPTPTPTNTPTPGPTRSFSGDTVTVVQAVPITVSTVVVTPASGFLAGVSGPQIKDTRDEPPAEIRLVEGLDVVFSFDYKIVEEIYFDPQDRYLVAGFFYDNPQIIDLNTYEYVIEFGKFEQLIFSQSGDLILVDYLGEVSLDQVYIQEGTEFFLPIKYSGGGKDELLRWDNGTVSSIVTFEFEVFSAHIIRDEIIILDYDAREKFDGELVFTDTTISPIELKGNIDEIYSSPTNEHFIISYTNVNNATSELYNTADVENPEDLQDTVSDVFWSPSGHSVVVQFKNNNMELRYGDEFLEKQEIVFGEEAYYFGEENPEKFILVNYTQFNSNAYIFEGSEQTWSKNDVYQIGLSQDNILLFLEFYQANPELWNVVTNELIIEFEQESLPDGQIYFDSNKSWLIFPNFNSHDELWDITERKLLLDLGAGVRGHQFLQRANRLFVWYEGGEAYQIDLGWLQTLDSINDPIFNEFVEVFCNDLMVKIDTNFTKETILNEGSLCIDS